MRQQQKKQILNFNRVQENLSRNNIEKIEIYNPILKTTTVISKDLLQIQDQINNISEGYEHSQIYLIINNNFKENKIIIEPRPFIGSA